VTPQFVRKPTQMETWSFLTAITISLCKKIKCKEYTAK